VVQGVLGGLNTGVALSRATWFAQGRSGAIDGYGDQTVNVNTSGYPTNVANGAPGSETDCSTVYNQLLQAGGRPVIGDGADTSPLPPALTDVQTAGYTNDFVSFVSAPICYYVYTGEGSTASAPVLEYDTSTGIVTLSSVLL
jgi:hypothetical protein